MIGMAQLFDTQPFSGHEKLLSESLRVVLLIARYAQFSSVQRRVKSQALSDTTHFISVRITFFSLSHTMSENRIFGSRSSLYIFRSTFLLTHAILCLQQTAQGWIGPLWGGYFLASLPAEILWGGGWLSLEVALADTTSRAAEKRHHCCIRRRVPPSVCALMPLRLSVNAD